MATLNHRRTGISSVGRDIFTGLSAFAFLGLWLLSALPAGAQAEKERISRVFSYGSASPAEVEETLKALLTAEGKYSFMPEKQKVMVRDIPDRVEMIGSLLAEMAKPQPNVRIELSFQEFSGGQSGGIQVSGNVGGRDVRVGNSPVPRNGIVIGGGSTQVRSTTNSGQFLLVQGGQTAYIEVAKQVPFADYFYGYASNLGIAVPAIRWESVGTRMAVRPDVQGDLIRVEIVPELTTLSGGQNGILTLKQLATVVTVANGVPVQIGGFKDAAADFNLNFFSGAGGSRRGGNSTFTLKATVQ